MGIIIEIWDALLLQPMLNALVFLYGVLASNFGLSIIAFTIAVRIAMYPLTRKQLNASRSMSRLQPKIQEIRQKHGKDSQKVTQETMKLYKEEGVNPIGCLGPMFVQLPIWIGLYQSIIQAMPRNPRAPCRSLSEAVLLAPRRPLRHTPEQGLPLVRPLGAGPHQGHASLARRRLDVGAAEDDGHRVHGPETDADEPDDAVDDARDVRHDHHRVSQRPGLILGRVQHHRYCLAIPGRGVGQPYTLSRHRFSAG